MLSRCFSIPVFAPDRDSARLSQRRSVARTDAATSRRKACACVPSPSLVAVGKIRCHLPGQISPQGIKVTIDLGSNVDPGGLGMGSAPAVAPGFHRGPAVRVGNDGLGHRGHLSRIVGWSAEASTDRNPAPAKSRGTPNPPNL